MKIYMEVDLKNKELPTGRFSESAVELAKLCGVSMSAVRTSACHAKKGERRRFVAVEIEDDD